MSSPPQVWEILGIAPTSEQGAIRKAYAARLKEVQPEEDPAGFQLLRAAYESALRAAKGTMLPADRTAARSASSPPAPVPAESAALEEALARLARTLRNEAGIEGAAFRSALEDVLTDPRMFHVGDFRSTESRIARMMLESLPRSDGVLPIVVERFGWHRSETSSRHSKEVLAVMSRTADLEIVAKLRAGTDNDARVFRMLSTPAPKSWIVRRYRAIFLDQAVREFMQRTLPARPALASWLDQRSSALWLGILGRPHLSKRALLAMPVYSALALAALWIAAVEGAISPDLRRPLLALALCSGPILALAKLYIFSWPVHWLMLKRRGRPFAAWVRVGWLPASACLVLIAGAPAAGWMTAVIAALGSSCLLVWATVASAPVFVAEGLSFSEKLRFSFARNIIMIYWTCLIAAGAGAPAALATLGALSASAIADASARKIWLFDTPRATRVRLGIALLIAVSSVLSWIWMADRSGRSARLAAALVTAAVLLHRPLQSVFARGAREFVGVFTGLMILSALNARHVDLRAPESLLLGGVMLVVLVSLCREFSWNSGLVRRALGRIHVQRLLDQESPLLPMITGLGLIAVGGHGLLAVSSYAGPGRVLHGGLILGGLFVLKRAFRTPRDRSSLRC